MSRAEFAWSRAVTVGAGVALAVLSLHGQSAKPAAQVEWKTHGSDLASTRYSPLDQIDQTNFSKLQVAWRLDTDIFGPRPDTLYSATPLMAGGILYTTAGTRSAPSSPSNAATGELLWMHAEDEGPRGQNPSRSGAGRGVVLLVERRRIGPADHLCDAGVSHARARRQDRHPSPDVRQRRVSSTLKPRQRSGARSRSPPISGSMPHRSSWTTWSWSARRSDSAARRHER